MRVWDSELLRKKSELSPVTDGLLFWFDGQDEFYPRANPAVNFTHYTFDRVSGVQLDFNVSSNMTVENLNGFLSVTKTDARNAEFKFQNTTFPTSFDAIRTVEFVAKDNYPNFLNSFEPSGSNVYFTSLMFPAAAIPSNVHFVGIVDYQTQLPSVYFNGTLYRTGSTSTNTPTGKPYLRSTRTCKIGCVRLYSKALSPEEILQNYKYEQSIGRVI